ncbi:DMT family protein [Methylocystis parvus]|uniref:DMT family protein n=1 Tax=Methylocystis parvus TaxID=134 RepID=A0A6B8M9N1_9HYPH|nr:DMT family protein [Methylocystis parvus]QGM99115.1 DMT family protein [Methylocystis parvus]WBK00515.1 DMT family protein [Methylocystis parvus OBBP]
MLAFLRSPAVAPIILLCVSNFFMTAAWYGHLKFPRLSLPQAIMMGWIIALFEYCLAVPANRIGYGVYSAAQLKTIQEVVTLVIFTVFSFLVLGEAPTWRTMLGFSLIAAGAFFVFETK